MDLATGRLRLRPLTLADAPAVHRLMSDPAVMAFWDSPPIADPAVTKEFLARMVADADAFYWAIERRQDGAFIGCCDLSDIDPDHRRGDIGFMLGREHWGKGYAFEAMQQVIAHARALGLKRLQARTHLGHARSIRLLERLGFAQEGRLRSYIERDGERRDCLIFGRLI
jgi:[ribosomal protein S5]-alanine N-acetyltransferase